MATELMVEDRKEGPEEEVERITKITLNVKNRLLKEMKHLAINNDTTFTDEVNQAIEEYLQNQKKRKVRK